MEEGRRRVDGEMCIVWPGEIVTYGIHLWASSIRRRYVPRSHKWSCTYAHAHVLGKGAAQHKGVPKAKVGPNRDNSRALTRVTTHRSEPSSPCRREPLAERLTVALFPDGNAHRLTRDELALIGLSWAQRDWSAKLHFRSHTRWCPYNWEYLNCSTSISHKSARQNGSTKWFDKK